MKNKRLILNTLSIGAVAARTGLATSAIRHYEDAGLVHPHRTDSGQRRFMRADVRRLSLVLIAQRLGFTLAEIRAELDTLPRDRAPSRADWAAMSTRFRHRLDARITRLQDLRDRLDGCIGCGCLSLDTCALYNPGDHAARRGTGPRYLQGDTPLPAPPDGGTVDP